MEYLHFNGFDSAIQDFNLLDMRLKTRKGLRRFSPEWISCSICRVKVDLHYYERDKDYDNI